MKLTLKNFRHHENREFIIPDSGYILLSGVTGAGKSTILNAIQYVLYGNIRKPYTFGKTTCQVLLEYKKDKETIKIDRTSHPNRLLVIYKKIEYEDDSAQSVIDNFMGMVCNEFMASSYITQGSFKSLVFMTPAEQVSFIETLTFSNNDHLEYRKKFKEYVKQCQIEVIKVEEQISSLQAQLKGLEDCIKKSKVQTFEDIGNVKSKDIHSDIEALKKMISTFERKENNLVKILNDLKEKEKFNKSIIEEKNKLDTEVSQFKQMVEDIGEINFGEELKILQNELNKAKISLEHTRDYKKYNDSIDNIELLKSEHFKEIEETLNKLKSNLPENEYILNLEKNIQTLESNVGLEETIENKIKKEKATKEIKAILKQVKELYETKVNKPSQLITFLENERKEAEELLNKEQNKLNDNRELAKQAESLKQKYNCPECSNELSIMNNSLVLTKTIDVKIKNKNYDKIIKKSEEEVNILQTEIKELNDWIQKLNELIPDFSLKISKTNTNIGGDLNEQKTELINIRNSQNQINELQTQLDNKSLPSSIIKLSKEIEKVKTFPKKFNPEKSIEELEEMIHNKTVEIEKVSKMKGDYCKLNREIKTREKRLEGINRRLNNDLSKGKDKEDVESVTTNLDNIRKNILDYTKSLNTFQEKLNILDNYKNHMKDVNRKDNISKEIKDKEELLKSKKINLEGAYGLEQAGKDAEIISLEKTLYNINEYAKVYLDTLFKEPISVRLENKKITKDDTKLKMNVVLEYRGKIYNDVNELSGGEKQCCNLAFILAVNDMVGSRILFLDECLNYLDEGNNMDIISYLRENSNNKLIIVVSHEAVQGNFDDIVTL